MQSCALMARSNGEPREDHRSASNSSLPRCDLRASARSERLVAARQRVRLIVVCASRKVLHFSDELLVPRTPDNLDLLPLSSTGNNRCSVDLISSAPYSPE